MWMVLFLALAAISPSTAARPVQHSQDEKNHRLYHRHHHYLRQHPSTWELAQLSSGLRALCVPITSQTLEDHEGRHKCTYNHTGGFRAVGVGYNLDENVDTRRAELSALLADYDKVYSGKSCLCDLQITALLALDAIRALDRASDSVVYLDDLCCDLQAVLADVQHSVGVAKGFPVRDLKQFIEKAVLKEWNSAAQALNQTHWCSENQDRCVDNMKTINSGCNTLFTIGG